MGNSEPEDLLSYWYTQKKNGGIVKIFNKLHQVILIIMSTICTMIYFMYAIVWVQQP